MSRKHAREAPPPPLVAQIPKRDFGKAASARNRPTPTCHGTPNRTINAESTEANREALSAMRHINILSTTKLFRASETGPELNASHER
jgi:hypothetical protein